MAAGYHGPYKKRPPKPAPVTLTSAPCKCPECKETHRADVTSDYPEKDGLYLVFCPGCMEGKYWQMGLFAKGEDWRTNHARKPRSTWRQHARAFEDY